jgi:hypothetical protein
MQWFLIEKLHYGNRLALPGIASPTLQRLVCCLARAAP